ncbi:MAG: hypothetical protein IRZ03_16220 [Acidobacterium ailaaui]|nr:hypothetical protein [Pseudacidobacterium ailaaui]
MAEQESRPRQQDQQQPEAQAEEQGHMPPLLSPAPAPAPATMSPVHHAGVESEQGQAIARYRKQIEAFNEDYEPPLGRLIRNGLITVAYVAPPLIALIVGMELGDEFGGAWALTSFSVGMHLSCLLAEILLSALVLGCMHLLRRLQSDPAVGSLFGAALTLLIILCCCSSAALWWLIAQREPSLPAPIIASRVLIAPLIDVSSLVALAALQSQSLSRYLATLARKEEALLRLAEADLRLREAEQAAINRQREYEEFRAMRQRNEEVLLKMLELQSRGALAAMERQVRLVEAEADSEQESDRPALPPAPPAPPPGQDPGRVPGRDPLVGLFLQGPQRKKADTQYNGNVVRE